MTPMGICPTTGRRSPRPAPVNNSGSWAYQILPYVEQQQLFDSQTGTLPTSWESGLSVLLCPLRGRPGYVSGTITSPEAATTTGSYQLPGQSGGFTYVWDPPNPSIGSGPNGVSWNINGTQGTTNGGSGGSFAHANGSTSWTFYNETSSAVTLTYTIPPPTQPGGGPVTDYGINPYINSSSGTINASDVHRRLITISDGTSNTILVGYMYYALTDYPVTTPGTTLMPIFSPGTEGTGRSSLGNSATYWLQDGTAASSNQWGSPMADGALMAMCDGSVHMFPYSVSLANFLTPDDGNAVEVP